MQNLSSEDLSIVLKRLAEFRKGRTSERVFIYRMTDSSHSVCCLGHNSIAAKIAKCIKGGLLEFILRLPFNKPKISLLRFMGATIGKNVEIAPGVWIDPIYTDLLTIEDNVMIGMFAKIFMHEFRNDEFRLGKVILRKGSLIGGMSLIRCGVEVGEKATVALGTVLGRDVAPGATVGGNPARLFKGTAKDEEEPQ